jgi:allophanate hydrolase
MGIDRGFAILNSFGKTSVNKILLDISNLREAYASGRLKPGDVIRESYRRIRSAGERPVWITVVAEEESVRRAESLGPFNDSLPLYGIPFAIKDNIDLAGVPTTAACPEFAFIPAKSAAAVGKLMAAGAIPIGKTNMDQFATGLVGTRSPYGACSSVVDRSYISGGSSSGSAVAVASDQVSFALGTDTAGSGRIPAAFNGIVGLKPTRGSISTSGVVPACRTLDCISIFAGCSADARLVLDCAAGFDPDDGYSKRPGQRRAWLPEGFRFGVPAPELLKFFGDDSAPALFENAKSKLTQLGGIEVDFDFAIFREAADLLYSGPWVAERLAAIRDFAAEHPQSLHPVIAQIILGADSIRAADAFRDIYRLASLMRSAEAAFLGMDLMLLPTAGSCYTLAQVAAEPLALNTNLGYYTNFVNLLDLAAIAIPAGTRASGMPFGVSLIAPAWSDQALLGLADRLHSALAPGVPVGLGQPYCPAGYIPLAVCGAHLSGQPLNHQLTDAGAFLIEMTTTSSGYRLYALRGTIPPKPGLVRAKTGAPIEVEVWAFPEDRLGGFVAGVPPPLAIGSCMLASGATVKSFVCEPYALDDAVEITEFGGWRRYVSAGSPAR